MLSAVRTNGQCEFCYFRSLFAQPQRNKTTESIASFAQRRKERRRRSVCQTDDSTLGDNKYAGKPADSAVAKPDGKQREQKVKPASKLNQSHHPTFAPLSLKNDFVQTRYDRPTTGGEGLRNGSDPKTRQVVEAKDLEVAVRTSVIELGRYFKSDSFESDGEQESSKSLKRHWADLRYELGRVFFKENVKQLSDAETALYSLVVKEWRVGKYAGVKEALLSLTLKRAFEPEASSTQTNHQKTIADLRFPIEWYPATRELQRTVHLHVGPTNSGKTYQALKRLETAKSGFYGGPLRLLAHEVYTRLNAKRPCALLTGEERRIPEKMNSILASCTVEMLPLNVPVDVAVIDEIQMMGHQERGNAWTAAFLGVMAKEVHLCGELRTVNLIRQLCAAMGDKLEIHRYERLSGLSTMQESLSEDFSKLEKGDCIIVFSRLGIHDMKARVERATGKQCAVIYGNLPPETRAQQASLFNDPDNDYDFLIATDAVGMGLNLSIKRVVFEATAKYNGIAFQTLKVPELKQIAGRAGRFKTATEGIKASVKPEDIVGSDSASELSTSLTSSSSPSQPKAEGLVTTWSDFDLPIIRQAMSTEVKSLKAAGISPPSMVYERFASYFPKATPFSYIMRRLQESATLNPLFFFCDQTDMYAVADLIQPFRLTIDERLIFTAAPISCRDRMLADATRGFARCVAEQRNGDLLDIPEMPLSLLDREAGPSALAEFESLHRVVMLYLWLTYRFAGVFRSQGLAFHVKALVEAKIDGCLSAVRVQDWHRARNEKLRRRAAENALSEQAERRESEVLRFEERKDEVLRDMHDGGRRQLDTLTWTEETPKADADAAPGAFTYANAHV